MVDIYIYSYPLVNSHSNIENGQKKVTELSNMRMFHFAKSYFTSGEYEDCPIDGHVPIRQVSLSIDLVLRQWLPGLRVLHRSP